MPLPRAVLTHFPTPLMPANVAIQGFAGSFHEVAARQYFGAAPALLPCATFEAVVASVLGGQAEVGLMAIENSLAGSIMPNFTLLERAAVWVSGEVYLPIRQQLLTLPGTTLADVQAVHSHPMALRQCANFWRRYPHWQLVETDDTGRSAELLARHQAPGVAVVAGRQAAQQFGLAVLMPDIHDDALNYTRFLVVERQQAGRAAPAGANKASLYFHAPHQPGSLARVLTQIAGHGLNLSKLESVPRLGQPWHYAFHADVEFDEPAQLAALLSELPGYTEALRVLGTYRKGSMNEEL